MSLPNGQSAVIHRPANAAQFDEVNGQKVILKTDRYCRIGYQDPTAPNGIRLCDNNEPFSSRRALREHVMYWHAEAPRNELYFVYGSRASGPTTLIARQRRNRNRGTRARRTHQPAQVPAPAVPVAAQNAAQAAAIAAAISGGGPQTFTTTVFPAGATIGGVDLSYQVRLRPTAVDRAHLAQHATISGSQTGGTGQPNVAQTFGYGEHEHMV